MKVDHHVEAYWSRLSADCADIPLYSQWARMFSEHKELAGLGFLTPQGQSPGPIVFAAFRWLGEQENEPYFQSLRHLPTQHTDLADDKIVIEAFSKLLRYRRNHLESLLVDWKWHAPDTHYLRALGHVLRELCEQRAAIELREIGACMGFGLIADGFGTSDLHSSITVRKGCDLRPLRATATFDVRIAELLAWPRGADAQLDFEKALVLVQSAEVFIEAAEGFRWLRERQTTCDATLVMMANFVFSNLPPHQEGDAIATFLALTKSRRAWTIIGDRNLDQAGLGRLLVFSPNSKLVNEVAFDYKTGRIRTNASNC